MTAGNGTGSMSFCSGGQCFSVERRSSATPGPRVLLKVRSITWVTVRRRSRSVTMTVEQRVP